MDEKQEIKPEENSLDGPTSPTDINVSQEVNSLDTTQEQNKQSPAVIKAETKRVKKFSGGIKSLAKIFNIYLLSFILILIISAFIIFISYQRSKKESVTPTLTTTPLSSDTLNQLNSSDTKVGDPKQTLSIESNAIFSGTVLIKGSLDVAGTIKVGGALTLPGLNVAGASSFDQINANKLSVSGDTSVQGSLNVQKNLTIAGNAQFSGPVSVPQLTVKNLILESDLAISRHIDAGGVTPSKSDGTALGSGGSSSLSGTDTAGTLTINTGSGPIAGCFATVTFVNKFSNVPHVVITPVGSSAAGLNYYINRTTTNFSVCTTNGAPAGSNFSFDYVTID